MAISVSNAIPVSHGSTVQGSPKGQAQAASVARAATDTVKLSQSGQIHAMRHLGQGAAQIANSLGVTLAAVNSVLGIAPAKVATPAVDVKVAAENAPEPSKASVAHAAPVGVQAGPTPVAEMNVAKG